MRIAIATDHNGVNEKKVIMENLKDYDFLDYSPNNTDTDDYPDYAFKLAQDVANKKVDLGILMCGTGIGMSIAANKVKGIRCAHCSSVSEAKLARLHNDANIMATSYKYDINLIISMIKEFIETSFSSEERHSRRIAKIIKYEDGAYNEL